MDLRPLGSTGLLVSPIGLGTVKLGRNRGVKYPGGDGFALPSDEQATDLLRTALELGVNLIDTAPAYGTSEQRLGALMHANGWFGGRDRWVLSTKAGEEFDNDSVEGSQSHFDFAPTAIRASVERSMRRLRTDYLDLVLLHSDGRDEWIIRESGALEVLAELARLGSIRAFGMSVKTVDGGLMALRKSEGACDVVMTTYNPAHRAEGYVIDSAAHRGIGILVKKALGSGHLADLWRKTPAEFKATTQDPVEAALRFVFLRRGVSSIVLGTARPDHLRSNIIAAERAIASFE